MKFLTRVVMLFYATIISCVCMFFFLVALNIINLDLVIDFTQFVYIDWFVRVMLCWLSISLFCINIASYRMFVLQAYDDKNIAFNNPSGRVTVSLSALEDIVRRTVVRRPEIKDARVKMRVHNEVLVSRVRLNLSSEVNIPEVTSKIQHVVENKIHNTIGLEIKVDIIIYVGKIFPGKIKTKDKAEETYEEEHVEPPIPFQGYRA